MTEREGGDDHSDAYELRLAPVAARALTIGPPRGLPLAVATAVAEFITGPLLDHPSGSASQ